jgi:hypothetical protein
MRLKAGQVTLRIHPLGFVTVDQAPPVVPKGLAFSHFSLALEYLEVFGVLGRGKR